MMKSYNPDAKTLSAREVARILGVRPATVYTYVSRGWLRSLPGHNRRERRYLRSEVEGLKRRSQSQKGHEAVAAGAMGWGQPVIDTAVGAITPDGPAYRGVRARDGLRRGFEAACALLWQEERVAATGVRWRAAPGDGEAIGRLLAFISQPGADPGADHLHVLRACALSLVPAARARAAEQAPTLAEVLALSVDRPDLRADFDAALVWCADHGLNASTFAVRVAASTGAGRSAVLAAGLATLSGPRHGTAANGVLDWFDAIEAECTDGWGPELATRELLDRLEAKGGSPPGLGHPLYPHGDPRGRDLLERSGRGPEGAFGLAVARVLAERGYPPPDLDFGLAALTRAHKLPRDTPQRLFAIGRMAGWLAHMDEQQQRGALIRPRSRYVGPLLR